MVQAPQCRIISLGTLSAHPLWNESRPVRTGHATTALVTSGDANIIVNPGLPAAALAARMSERTKLRADEVTHVFLTSFHIECRRGIELFDDADWFIHEPERAYAASAIRGKQEEAAQTEDAQVIDVFRREQEVLDACRDAPDKLAPNVDLFPLPGVTPGTCGLLLSLWSQTLLIAGDAIPTVEHLLRGQVLPHCEDVEQAQESFREAIEIADAIVPGRDNLVSNPVRRPTGGSGPAVK